MPALPPHVTWRYVWEHAKFATRVSWVGWKIFFHWIGEHRLLRPDSLSYDAYLVRHYLLTHPREDSWTKVFLCVGVPRGWTRERFDEAVLEFAAWLGVKELT